MYDRFVSSRQNEWNVDVKNYSYMSLKHNVIITNVMFLFIVCVTNKKLTCLIFGEVNIENLCLTSMFSNYCLLMHLFKTYAWNHVFILIIWDALDLTRVQSRTPPSFWDSAQGRSKSPIRNASLFLRLHAGTIQEYNPEHLVWKAPCGDDPRVKSGTPPCS